MKSNILVLIGCGIAICAGGYIEVSRGQTPTTEPSPGRREAVYPELVKTIAELSESITQLQAKTEALSKRNDDLLGQIVLLQGTNKALSDKLAGVDSRITSTCLLINTPYRITNAKFPVALDTAMDNRAAINGPNANSQSQQWRLSN